MFEEGKTYRVKTLEQLLATPGATLRSASDVVDFSTNTVVYALCNSMNDYLGATVIPDRIISDGKSFKYASYTFIPEMILWETKKLRLLNAIKAFK